MINFLLIIAIGTLSYFSTVLNKYFQLSVKNNIVTMVTYNFINAIFGSIYFLVICKFKIIMNLTTFIFAALYAAVVINSLVVGVVALSKISISLNSILSISGSVIGSVFFGTIFFGETVTLQSIAATLLMILAIVFPCLGMPSDIKKNSLAVCLWVFSTSVLGSSFLKFYTESPTALNSEYMFFITNTIVACSTLILLIFLHLKRKSLKNFKNLFLIFKKKDILNIAVRTAISNISSIISVLVIASMDVSLYTIITSSLSMISSMCISKFVFHEKLFRENYISLTLALTAIIVRSL